ncbi:MAG: methyl-accepting chemotaxis protein [Oscillospiraceae bacterium]|nr:methyl-accepting chemotaxis protein [Oscillospiraceae bacterium]
MLKFKKLSLKITFIVGATVIIVGGSIAGYMQTRIINEMGKYSSLHLRNQAMSVADESEGAFVDVIHKVESMRNLAGAVIDVDEYKNDPEGYTFGALKDKTGGFFYNTIDSSDYILAAYLTLHPALAGTPYVGEIYFLRDDDGIEFIDDPLDFDEYSSQESPDMQWFYGAYNSGKPYWSRVYTEEETGITMVSYTEPVFLNGAKVGVVGADIAIEHIGELIESVQIYETGFALIESNYGEFIETDSPIGILNASEKQALDKAARANRGGVFEIKLKGANYLITSLEFPNEYILYIVAPKSEVNAAITASLFRFLILFAVGFVLVIILSYFIAKPIGKPLTALSIFLKRAASTGNLTLLPEDIEAINKYSPIPDETGQVVGDTAAFIRHVAKNAEALEALADGDLTCDVNLQSNEDTMGIALRHLFGSLNDMFNNIVMSSQQAVTSSKQIADSSQSMSQGAVEQAAAIQELSSSITQIAEKTRHNAALSERTAKLADTIKDNAEKGSRQMDDMTEAVKEINNASSSIGKVIKVIDDIAFQTNILALNAAVEAARAGEAGKGFAVVANEVSNLASKSAEAAKNTAALIQNSIEKAELGSKIAHETAESLREIVSGINESNGLIAEISNSSEEQAQGITQINIGIEQVSLVVQQNSATAEENAAASQEMSGQSEVLQKLTAQFKLK